MLMLNLLKPLRQFSKTTRLDWSKKIATSNQLPNQHQRRHSQQLQIWKYLKNRKNSDPNHKASFSQNYWMLNRIHSRQHIIKIWSNQSKYKRLSHQQSDQVNKPIKDFNTIMPNAKLEAMMNSISMMKTRIISRIVEVQRNSLMARVQFQKQWIYCTKSSKQVWQLSRRHMMKTKLQQMLYIWSVVTLLTNLCKDTLVSKEIIGIWIKLRFKSHFKIKTEESISE